MPPPCVWYMDPKFPLMLRYPVVKIFIKGSDMLGIELQLSSLQGAEFVVLLLPEAKNYLKPGSNRYSMI